MIRVLACLLTFGIFAGILEAPYPMISEETWARASLSARDLGDDQVGNAQAAASLGLIDMVLGLTAGSTGADGTRALLLLPWLFGVLVFGWILAERLGPDTRLPGVLATAHVVIFAAASLEVTAPLGHQGVTRLLLLGWAAVISAPGIPAGRPLAVGMLLLSLVAPDAALALPLLAVGVVVRLAGAARPAVDEGDGTTDRVIIGVLGVALLVAVTQLETDDAGRTPLPGLSPLLSLSALVAMLALPLATEAESPESGRDRDGFLAPAMALAAVAYPEWAPAALATGLWALASRGSTAIQGGVLVLGVGLLGATTRSPEVTTDPTDRAFTIQNRIVDLLGRRPFEGARPRVLIDPAVSARLLRAPALQPVPLYDPRDPRGRRSPGTWAVAVDEADPGLPDRLKTAHVDALVLDPATPAEATLVSRVGWRAEALDDHARLIYRVRAVPGGLPGSVRDRVVAARVDRTRRFLEGGNPCRASWEIQQALWIGPDDPEALVTRAQTYGVLGDVEGVRRTLDHLLETADRDIWQPRVEERMIQALRWRRPHRTRLRPTTGPDAGIVGDLLQ